MNKKLLYYQKAKQSVDGKLVEGYIITIYVNGFRDRKFFYQDSYAQLMKDYPKTDYQFIKFEIK